MQSMAKTHSKRSRLRVSRWIMARGVALISIRGKLRCLFCSIVVIAALFMFVFTESIPYTSEKSQLLLQSISESRIILALWCGSIFLLIVLSLAVLVAWILSMFLNRERQRVTDLFNDLVFLISSVKKLAIIRPR